MATPTALPAHFSIALAILLQLSMSIPCLPSSFRLFLPPGVPFPKLLFFCLTDSYASFKTQLGHQLLCPPDTVNRSLTLIPVALNSSPSSRFYGIIVTDLSLSLLQALAPKHLSTCLQSERDLNQKNETHLADFRAPGSGVRTAFPLLGFDTRLHHGCKWAFLGGPRVLRELDGSPRQLVLHELAWGLMAPRPLWPSAGSRPFGGGRASRLGGPPPRASH